MTAAQSPLVYETSPGHPDNFPAYRYYHVGASHEELTELSRRHASLPPAERLARVEDLARQPNDVVIAELNALREQANVPEVEAGRSFPGKESDVLDAVGDDRGLVVAALAEEKAQDKPRAGLVKKLEAKLLPPEGNSTGEPSLTQNTLVDASGVQGGNPGQQQ
jgi:hypothetical protein